MVLDMLTKVVADALEVSPETLDDASGVDKVENWDSISQLRVVLEVERAFAVQFDTARLPDLTSLGALRAEVERLAGSGA